jgi:hypothetical protein
MAGTFHPSEQRNEPMTASHGHAEKVPWRKLRFETTDQCADEVRRIAQADQEGKLRIAGNWTPGQVMAHVAAWIEYAYEGFPIRRPPFFIRWILRLQRQRILSQGMPRGIKIPRVEGGTTGIDDMESQAAAQRLLAALTRLKSPELAPHASPAFGPMSHEDRIRLNLRHAELHLGHLSY